MVVKPELNTTLTKSRAGVKVEHDNLVLVCSLYQHELCIFCICGEIYEGPLVERYCKAKPYWNFDLQVFNSACNMSLMVIFYNPTKPTKGRVKKNSRISH